MADETDGSSNPQESEVEGLRLKELAEEKYVAGNIKSAMKYAKRAHRLHPSLHGVREMLTAFKILRAATKTVDAVPADDAVLATAAPTPSPPDYYKILQVECFAHINSIKKQYKKLALTLHPDKNPFVASEEAFKHVGEAFRVLSDKIRRKEYDMRVRIAMQSEAEAAVGLGLATGEPETFWTACSTCRLLHKFERKYLGHNLVCPSCKKSFKAVEVDEEEAEENERVDKVEKLNIRVSERIRARKDGKMSSVRKGLERSAGSGKGLRTEGENEGLRVKKVEKDLRNKSEGIGLVSSVGGGLIERLRSRSGRKEERSTAVEVVERTRAKRAKVGEEETMTLAQMQMLAKRKVSQEKMKLREKEKGKENKKENEKENKNEKMAGIGEKEKEKENEKENENEKMAGIGEKEMEMEKDNEREMHKLKEKQGEMTLGTMKERDKRERRAVVNDETVEIVGRRTSKRNRDLKVEKQKKSQQHDLDIVAAVESDFHDFDKDRMERSFKKGQVWATYDKEDRMPRRYALIDEVISVYPFEVRLSWLEFQANGDEQLISWEKMGFHISCGKFKVSGKTSLKTLKAFSHITDSERTARELYWVYPKKGSVWALYNENALDSHARGLTVKDKFCYDIVVLLTSYSEIHGMSIAYLEKVDKFKTIFKRREIGAHAIRWLEKDDFRLFSHQIPARKLSGEETSGLSQDCWELDPSSLPPKPLTIGWGR